jgi:hypothetical protein
LYKFILKRVLGPILDDELLLDQISLTSRDGLVELNDIALNCDYLNGFLGTTPVRLRSCTLRSLAAKLSYSDILEDGIFLLAGGVVFEIEPIESGLAAGSHSAGVRSVEAKGKDEPRKEPNSSRDSSGMKQLETEGLQCLASWIEIIIAKLRVSVEDITVRIYSSHEKSAPPCLVVKLANIMYYNSHPHEKACRSSSVELSTRLTASNRSSIISLGRRKVPHNLNNYPPFHALFLIHMLWLY